MYRRLLRHLFRCTTDPCPPQDPGDTTAVSREATAAAGGPAARRGRAALRTAVHVAAHVAVVVLMLSIPAAAFADPTGPTYLAANTLPQVIANLQAWVMGILAAIATLFLVLGGVYRVTAGGDPAQVDKSNTQFKNALIGYALAVLAPVLLEIVKGIIGG